MKRHPHRPIDRLISTIAAFFFILRYKPSAPFIFLAKRVRRRWPLWH